MESSRSTKSVPADRAVMAAVAAAALCLFPACSTSSGSEPKAPAPQADFSRMGAGFPGPGRDETAPVPETGVKIGFTGPEKTAEGREFRAAVELAIEDANAAGGFKGRPFVPVFRFDDGPWGMVSKQVVALAYEDQVWAIVGGLDGGRAHVAELIAAKAWMPVVTSAASDYTIDYANVPWVFRVMPSDSAQAVELLRHAKDRGWKRVVLLTEAERDARSARDRIVEAARKIEIALDPILEIDPLAPEAAARRLVGAEVSAVLLWGRRAFSLAILRAMRIGGVSAPVLASVALASPEVAAESPPAAGWGELIVAAPYDMSRPSPDIVELERRLRERAGVAPSSVAVVSYDAARLTLEAVRRADLSRARIRDELAKARHPGLCGSIGFSELGGNPAAPVLLRLEDGKWARAGTER